MADLTLEIVMEQMEFQNIPSMERIQILNRFFGFQFPVEAESYAERIEMYEELFPPELDNA